MIFSTITLCHLVLIMVHLTLEDKVMLLAMHPDILVGATIVKGSGFMRIAYVGSEENIHLLLNLQDEMTDPSLLRIVYKLERGNLLKSYRDLALELDHEPVQERPDWIKTLENYTCLLLDQNPEHMDDEFLATKLLPVCKRHTPPVIAHVQMSHYLKPSSLVTTSTNLIGMLQQSSSSLPESLHSSPFKYSASALPGPESIKNQESEKSPKEIIRIKREQGEEKQDSTYSIRSTDKVALEEFDLKSALFKHMNKNKTANRNPANYHLYHALMEALIADEDAMDKEVAVKVKDHKRKHDSDDEEDNDDDEGPSAGSNQGRSAKRRRPDSATSGSAQPPSKDDHQSSKKPRESDAYASKQHPALTSTGWQITDTRDDVVNSLMHMLPNNIQITDTNSFIVSKKRSSNSSKKLKGIQTLTPAEQEAADIMKALKESKKMSKRQPGTGGSNEGTGNILGVPDESTVISRASSEGTGSKPGLLFNPSPSVAVVQEPIVSTGTPSSTRIDQDTPSTSTSQTTQEEQSHVIPTSVEEDDHGIEVAHMDNDLISAGRYLLQTLGQEKLEFLMKKVGMQSMSPEMMKKLADETEELWWYLFMYHM
ncbi:hypothetical protein Tco_0746133 [Tanacetum coccineum]